MSAWNARSVTALSGLMSFALVVLGCTLDCAAQTTPAEGYTFYVAPHSHIGRILRGHENTGKKGRVTIVLDMAPTQTWLADLTERPLHSIPVEHGKIQFDCNAFEFVTLRLGARE
jgi:hypothetical protein